MMQSQKTLTRIIFAWTIINVCYGQLIHTLPNQSIFLFPPDTNDIYSAFDVQHELSEILYAAGKIEAPIDSVYPPAISSTDFWAEGSWGRGYYTQIVEYQPGNEIFRYNQWYSFEDNNDNIKYWACHPLIKDTGRRLIGYINAIKNVHYPADYDNLGVKIKDGIEYLLNVEQNSNGSFNWYPYRESDESTENSGVQENVYPTSIALRALYDGHIFLNNVMNDPSLNVQITEGINAASSFLINLGYDNPAHGHGNINNKYHAVWGLVGAYKLTGNTTYYDTAKAIAESSFGYQRVDGSWETPVSVQTEPCIENVTYKKWHDARIYYHGMILRGLSELYSIVENDGNFKNQLKERIVRSINHVIDYNEIPPDSGAPNSRLYSPIGIHDGRVFIIHRDEINKDCDPVVGNKGIDGQILNGLVSTRNNVDFNNEDTERLDQLINYIANGMANWINNVSYTKRVWHSDQKLMGLGKYIGNIKSVKLSNRDLSENNLYGSLSVDNVSIPSGNTRRFLSYDNDLHVLWTDEPELSGKRHLRWNSDISRLKLKENNIQFENVDIQTAYFDNQHIIPINSNLNIPIQIQDPWYLQNPNDLPSEWIQTGEDWIETTGNLQVFLNQNTSFNTAYPIYRLKAPNLYATENAIFKFDRWHGNNIKFNIDGDSETNNRITDVVFLNEQANVTAEYIIVNDQPSVYQVPEDDELIIPMGANILLAEGFKIEVDGTIIMDGGNSRITLNGNTNQPWSGIQVNGTGQIKLDNVVISNVETALLLDVNSLDNIIDHHISNLIVINSNYGIDIKTGTLFSPADLQEGTELTPLTINNCEFVGINNTAIRWQADPYFGYDNGFTQLGKLAIHNCKFIISEQGIDINGLEDNPNNFYASSVISNNYFSNCNYPVSITSTSIGPYYWYPTLVVPEPQEWRDEYDPGYALKNIVSYNRFYDYETALKVDGDVLLLTHHNLYDGESLQNSTAIDLTAYTEPPLHDPCHLHSHIIGNETIVNNSLGIKALISNEGNRVNCYTMIVDNTIFYENTDNYDAPGSDLYVDYDTNILNEDPIFVGEDNYHLAPGSPAIDSGSAMDYDLDEAADLDPDGSQLDMGAHYYQLPSTSLSFSPNMQVGDFPMLEWTPVNVGGGVVYYDIYYHSQFSTLVYMATTQTTSFLDIRYIVVEIEDDDNGGYDRSVKVKKNDEEPPEQDVIEIYYSIIVRDEASHNSPPSNEIMARVINAPNPKEMAEELLPEKYDLSQGFPNPFNPTITLPYTLPDLSTVVIHVYDITGRRVATLKNQMEEAGYYQIRWDGKNISDKPLSSGMYIIQMTAKSMEDGELFTKAQKVVLLK